MRISPLHNKLEQYGASFQNRYDIEVATKISNFLEEYNFIRNSVGLTDFSHMQLYTIPEESGLYFLDKLFAGNVAKIRFGKILHTFLANKNGDIVADCYIANNDEEYIILCESIINDNKLNKIFIENGASEAKLKNITDKYTLLSIDGYKAWAVAKELFGTDVLGLTYLSIEMYPFDNTEICVLRAGKTSEFGYFFMIPKDLSNKLFDTLLNSVKNLNGGLCGISVHNAIRLDGRFFNIYAEGSQVKDPLPLGLQWMIDFEKEFFLGFEAINKRRENGLKKKIIGIQTNATPDLFTPGSLIFDENNQIAEVKATCYSPVLDCCIGLALFPIDSAYSGLNFKLNSPDGIEIKTISMPPIMPKSLTVKLDEL